MRELNFIKAKEKKHFLKITMPDEQALTLTAPKKKIVDALQSIQGGDEAEIDKLYKIMPLVLNSNLEKIVYTQDQIDDLLDIEDVNLLFDAYMDFLGEISNSKN